MAKKVPVTGSKSKFASVIPEFRSSSRSLASHSWFRSGLFFPHARWSRTVIPVQVQFLLGAAGSGKTNRCLKEIRESLLGSPDGPLLLLIAPKQSTYYLE